MITPDVSDRLPRFAALFFLGIVAAACSASSAPPATATAEPTAAPAEPAVYWPTDGWRTAAPEEQNMDGGMIARVLEIIEEENLAFHSLLIIRNGYLVSETYFHGYTEQRKHDLYSVTKSFMATLVGIAIDQGHIAGVDTRMLDFFPDLACDPPDPQKDAMTLEDVLTMRTGLDWEEVDPTFTALYRSPDWVQYLFDLPMDAAPGSYFLYCSGCSHLLSAAVGQATGMPVRDFADEFLLHPLGITKLNWETDMQNIPIGGWGLSITPRDMAKLGYLYLHEGMWEGRRIVSAEWVRAATHRQTEAGPVLDYGYQWWTYAYLNAYAALGMYGQTVFVIPEKDLIIVTTAGMEGHDRIFQLIENYLAPAARPAG
jgi:CubicO group peptidase (beta-lactamase class C family)